VNGAAVAQFVYTEKVGGSIPSSPTRSFAIRQFFCWHPPLTRRWLEETEVAPITSTYTSNLTNSRGIRPTLLSRGIYLALLMKIQHITPLNTKVIHKSKESSNKHLEYNITNCESKNSILESSSIKCYYIK
jgi:hypothetical protein